MQKKIIVSATEDQHAAILADAEASSRKIGLHTLHLAISSPSVDKRLAALLRSKQPSQKNPARKTK